MARCTSVSGSPGAADFEDAVRQLGFTIKDVYYRVLVAQRRLALAEENRDRFARILDVNTIRFKKGYIAEVDLIRIADVALHDLQHGMGAEMAPEPLDVERRDPVAGGQKFRNEDAALVAAGPCDKDMHAPHPLSDQAVASPEP